MYRRDGGHDDRDRERERETSPGDAPPANPTVTLRLIAALLLIGATHLLIPLVIPFVVAIVIAIAMAPVVEWLRRRGIPNTLASLGATLLVAGALAAIAGLLVYQSGQIVQDGDRYLAGFSKALAQASDSVGGERLLETLGMPVGGVGGEDGETASRRMETAGGQAGAQTSDGDLGRYWEGSIRRNAREIGRWAASGLGGLLGFLGGIVLFLAFLFYMLQTRDEWMQRLVEAMSQLGLRPRRRDLEEVQAQLVKYVGCLGLVSLAYIVVISLALWMIGVPQPLLWGLLTGVLEVVPYFGPVLAAALPATVALSQGSLWQPLAVLALFAVLQTVEGYIVAPLLYGGAVEFNPVTVLFGVLFFGLVWGPLGLAVAMPMMIILRGLLVITPDTPALDALLVEEPDET